MRSWESHFGPKSRKKSIFDTILWQMSQFSLLFDGLFREFSCKKRKCIALCRVERAVLVQNFTEFFKVLLNAVKTFTWTLLVSVRLHFAFKVLGKLQYAVRSDVRKFLKVLLHALKTFTWTVQVSVRLHFALKVLGKWKYAVRVDFNEFFEIPLNALKTFIWTLLVSVRLHFASTVHGKSQYAFLSDFSKFLKVPHYWSQSRMHFDLKVQQKEHIWTQFDVKSRSFLCFLWFF